MVEVYLGLGGNIGNSCWVLEEAIKRISTLFGVSSVQRSRFYLTSPVGVITQNFFVNAVCRLETNLSVRALFWELQEVEQSLGKKPKSKNASRILDIDILLFGLEKIDEPDLRIPHPHWKERLFVLVPLLDLTKTLMIPDKGKKVPLDLQEILSTFPNRHQETVIALNH